MSSEAEKAFEEWWNHIIRLAHLNKTSHAWAWTAWLAACRWRAERDALFADVFDKRLGDRIRLDAGLKETP